MKASKIHGNMVGEDARVGDVFQVLSISFNHRFLECRGIFKSKYSSSLLMKFILYDAPPLDSCESRGDCGALLLITRLESAILPLFHFLSSTFLLLRLLPFLSF